MCFFDTELCERAFHLSPESIASRLSKAVERVSVVQDGVLIIASSKIVAIEEANEINDRLKRLLRKKRG